MPTPRTLVHQLITERIDVYPELYPPEAGTFDVLEGQQRAQAEALYKTVIQRWLTLRALLNKGLKKPIRRMESPLAAILMTAAAELLFMEGSPDYAVTHEAVEAAKVHRDGAGGLVNAALRRLIEIRGEWVDEVWDGQKDALPYRGGILTLAEGSLPDPKMGDSWMSVVYSHPIELISRWKKLFHQDLFGEDIFHPMLLSHLEPAPLYVHYPEARRIDASHYEVEESGDLVKWVGDRALLWELLRNEPMRCWVQDISAHAIVNTIRTCGGQGKLLDYCAGRGTKTRAALYACPELSVIATDLDQDRYEDLKKLERHSDRLQVLEFNQWRSAPEMVDIVLLDCPCTNSGTLSRRLEARYRLNASMIENMRQLQYEILTEACQWVKPGGHLIYSTCSMEPEENQELVIEWMDSEDSGEAGTWELISDARAYSGMLVREGWPVDGAYSALLHRVR